MSDSCLQQRLSEYQPYSSYITATFSADTDNSLYSLFRHQIDMNVDNYHECGELTQSEINTNPEQIAAINSGSLGLCSNKCCGHLLEVVWYLLTEYTILLTKHAS